MISTKSIYSKYKTNSTSPTPCKEDRGFIEGMKVEKETHLMEDSHGGIMSTSKAAEPSQLATSTKEIKEEDFDDFLQEHLERTGEDDPTSPPPCKEEKCFVEGMKMEQETHLMEHSHGGITSTSKAGQPSKLAMSTKEIKEENFEDFYQDYLTRIQDTPLCKEEMCSSLQDSDSSMDIKMEQETSLINNGGMTTTGDSQMKQSKVNEKWMKEDKEKKHPTQKTQHVKDHRTNTAEKQLQSTTSGQKFQHPLRQNQTVHMGEKRHQCIRCGKPFPSASQLRRHQITHTGEKPYGCATCGKSFTQQESLQRHQKIHTGEKRHQCTTCGKEFKTATLLRRHQISHTGEKPYECATCGKSFTRQSSLLQHQKIHTEEKPYECSTCGKEFREAQHLRRHRITHTGEKPYECSTCGKSFTQQESLQHHQRIHAEEKPHQCAICGKSFAQKSNLTRHQRTHTGEKPYLCVTCGQTFAGSSNLSTHKRTHTGEKPYPCTICGKTFRHVSYLKTHQRIHSGEKPYQCATCGMGFSDKSHFNKHQKRCNYSVPHV